MKPTGDEAARQIEPLAILLIAPASALAELKSLREDPRFEILATDRITPAWISLAHRIAGTVLFPEDDPFSALAYAATAGLENVVVLARKRYASELDSLIAAGALDCIQLPLTSRALDRLAAVLRGRSGSLRVNAALRLMLDPVFRTARYGSAVVALSQREYVLLHYLNAASGRAVSAASLLTDVWGESESVDRTRPILEVYICQLRRKLDKLGLRGALTTVRHYGYGLAIQPQTNGTER